MFGDIQQEDVEIKQFKNHFGGDEKKHANLEASCSF